jgi:hypothetical protein
MLSVNMLSIITFSAVMLSAIMLSIITLSVVMLNVVAPSRRMSVRHFLYPLKMLNKRKQIKMSLN